MEAWQTGCSCRECDSNYSYDLKQYQKKLWSSDGELTPHLQQDQLVKVTEGIILRDDKYIVPEALQKPVIKLYHDYAHVSAPKTQQLIQKKLLVATNGIRHSKMVWHMHRMCHH